MPPSAPTRTWSFAGRIAGWGTTSGTRFVLGNWHTTPLGSFAGVMVQRPDGHRILLAPSAQVAEFVSATYQFDAVKPTAVRVQRYRANSARGEPEAGLRPAADAEDTGLRSPADADDAGLRSPADAEDAGLRLPEDAEPVPPTASTTAGEGWQVEAGPLTATLQVGRRAGLGWLLRTLPAGVAAAPWFTYLTDPIARVVLPGVRTRGSAGGGRREYYGARDLHRISAAVTAWEGEDLGAMVPIDPPVQFGFASTPARPSVTDLVTTVRGEDP